MKKILMSMSVLLLVAAILHGAHGLLMGGQKWGTITAEALKQKMDTGEDLCLVNVLPRIVFNAGHIEGSINIPINKIETSGKLPADKDKPLIFYCMGVA